jgi:hypothetical protein
MEAMLRRELDVAAIVQDLHASRLQLLSESAQRQLDI